MLSMIFQREGRARAGRRVLALGVLVLALAACGSPTTPRAPALPVSLPHLPQMTIVASDDAFTLPASVPPGLVLVTLQNQGKQPHEAQFARLNSGTGAAQVVQAIEQQGIQGALALVTLAGGVNTIDPGQRQQVIVNLTQGAYLALSLTPDTQGRPQVDDQMYRPFSVSTSKSPASSLPPSNGEVTLKDYSMSLPDALFSAGATILKVTNIGPAPHEIALFRALPGKTLYDVLQFLQGHQTGSPPFHSMGGMGALAAQTSGWMLLHLTPGNYLAACILPSPVSGMTDVNLGMVMPFNVS